MSRQPQTRTGEKLLAQGFRHDFRCASLDIGLEACNCTLPDLLRNVEDEARAPFFELLAWIEDQTKPNTVDMSGKRSGFPHSEPRSERIWNRVQEFFDLEASMSECICGSFDPMRHQGFCHFGWHMEGCEHNNG